MQRLLLVIHYLLKKASCLAVVDPKPSMESVTLNRYADHEFYSDFSFCILLILLSGQCQRARLLAFFKVYQKWPLYFASTGFHVGGVTLHGMPL